MEFDDLLKGALPRARGAVGATLLEVVELALPGALGAVSATGLEGGCR